MSHREILLYKERLDKLFDMVPTLPDDEIADYEVKAHWARYLCVLTSGYLEVSVQTIYGGYARGKSAPNVVNFVENQLKRFRNLKIERITTLAGMFNPEWAKELGELTEGEIGDAVNSVVAIRNSIAHGEAVGITIGRMKQYYSTIVRLVKMLEDQCNQA